MAKNKKRRASDARGPIAKKLRELEGGKKAFGEVHTHKVNLRMW